MAKEKKKIVITYTGKKPISLNVMYSSHWTKRKKLKEDFLKDIKIYEDNEILGKYRVEIIFNNRLDCENNVAMSKIILDYLRYTNKISDDNTKFCKGFKIDFDEKLPKNTLIMKIIEI